MARSYSASSNQAIPPSVGSWLRQQRETKGFVQRAVAAAAQMDQSHYGKVELDKKFPTDAQATAIAQFLGIAETDFRARLAAARLVKICGGDATLTAIAASHAQEHAAPFLVNKRANKK